MSRYARQRAGVVAAAALQTSAAMRMVGTNSRDLAAALDALHGKAIQAKVAAQEAVALVTSGNRRADALYQSTHTIETITGLIAGVEHISKSVETTVQTQRAMTHEGTDQTAASSREIQSNVGAIHQAARLAAAGATAMERTAQSLTASSGHLMKRAIAFLDDVRAA